MLHFRAWELGIKSLYYLPLQIDPARRVSCRRRRGGQHGIEARSVVARANRSLVSCVMIDAAPVGKGATHT
jgi:hypothetical protein